MFISSFRERSLNGEHCAANYNKYLTIFPGVIGKLLRQNLSNQRETEHQGEDRCLNGLKITVHQMKCTRVKAQEAIVHQSFEVACYYANIQQLRLNQVCWQLKYSKNWSQISIFEFWTKKKRGDGGDGHKMMQQVKPIKIFRLHR